MTCLFCTLAANKQNIIYETNKIYVIVDRFPLSNCHLLLIPKEHKVTLDECEETTVSELFVTAQKLAKELKMKSFNILQNNFNGQIIKHCHVHLIEDNETGRLLLDKKNPQLEMNEGEYQELVARVGRRREGKGRSEIVNGEEGECVERGKVNWGRGRVLKGRGVKGKVNWGNELGKENPPPREQIASHFTVSCSPFHSATVSLSPFPFLTVKFTS